MTQTFEALILHYAEIYLKSDYVKKQFERVLEARIRYKLEKIGILKPKIKWKHNSLWVMGSFSSETVHYLASTFGISYVSPVVMCESTIPSIREAIEKLRSSILEINPTSYCVRAKKDKRISLSHYSVEYEVSSYFQNWKVDLKSPEFIIYLELKTSECCIFFEKIEGPGGFPYGTQGKVICLLSKGIDSPVAAYMMAKRGCEVIFLHFGSEKLSKIVDKFEIYAGKPVTFFLVDNQAFLTEIQSKHSGKYTCLLCKIGMYKIANHLAKQKKAKAVITGENLGQVASQTLTNLSVMESFSDLPILRPLIGFDKKEIIQLSRKIGLFDLYINPDCAFVPSSPSTLSSRKKLEKMMELVSFESILETHLLAYTSL